MSLNESTDEMLLQRFRATHCEDAFSELVRRHSPLVTGTARRILQTSADADDVAQTVFIALAMRAGRVRATPSVAPWLHKVTIRAALDFKKSSIRRLRREQVSTQESSESISLIVKEHLDKTIQALPSAKRDAVIAHYFEGFSIDEIARRENCGPSVISMRLTRARETLRKRLKLPATGALDAALAGASACIPAAPALVAFIAANAIRVVAGAKLAEPALLTLFEAARAALRPTLGQIAIRSAGATALAVVAITCFALALSNAALSPANPAPSSHAASSLTQLPANAVETSLPLAPPVAAGRLTVMWACDDSAEFLLNGSKVAPEIAYFAPNPADSVFKATIDAKPYDTLGFACYDDGGGRHLLVAVFKGEKYLFGSSDDAWVCTEPAKPENFPSQDWWNGRGGPAYPAIANRTWAKGNQVHGGIIDFFRTIGTTPRECWPIWGKKSSVAFIRTVLNPEDIER